MMHHPREIVADTANHAAPSRLDRAAPSNSAGDWLGDALGQMTGHIRERLAEVEAKHARSLAEMEERIARLSQTAHRARPDMPSDLARAFGRLEDGMNDLVKHIVAAKENAETDAGRFVFAPRQSEDTSFVTERPAPVAAPAAAFAQPYPSGAATDGGWDTQSAEALMQLYESGATGVSPAAINAAYAASADDQYAPRYVASTPMAPRTVVAGLGEDRRWVEDRFTAITSEIEHALASARPDAAIDRLLARVDSFETRFESALSSVGEELSSVAKTTHIRQLESQIGDMGKQMVVVRQQLDRLAGIEAQLQELNAIAAAAQEQGDEGEANPQAHAVVPAPQIDAETLASNVADLAVQRLSELLESSEPRGAAPVAANTEATENLLRSYMDERRRSDTATNGMLDTMQEALVRLIDRVEAIDVAQAEFRSLAASANAPAMASEATFGRRNRNQENLDEAAQSYVNAPDHGEHAPPATAQKSAMAHRAPRIPVENVQVESVNAAPEARDAKAGKPAAARASRVSAATAPAIQPELQTEEAPASDDANVKRTKPVKRAAPASSLGRRGIMVAMIALLLVGLSYVANLFLANRYGSMMPAATGTPQTEAPRAPAATAPPTPSDIRKSDAPPVQSAPPGLTVEPPRAPVPDRRTNSDVQRPATGGAGRSVPETVTDDLSAVDTPATTQLAQAHPAAIRPALPGIAIDTTSGPLRPSEVALLARRDPARLPGAMSPLMGVKSQDLPEFTKGSGPAEVVTTKPRTSSIEKASPPAKAANSVVSPGVDAARSAGIVTGTTNGPQKISLGRTPTAPTTPGSTSDDDEGAVSAAGTMPPATVGPMTLRMAAAQGDPSATFEVGARYAEGRGVKQDFAEAMSWYQRSAAKGFALAQYRLGTLYERGLGTPSDPGRARAWYTRAADQGNVKAMHNIAVLAAGRDTGGPDYAEAARWFTAAAERGLADSQFNLGVLHENGLGVAKDQRQAYKWYALAARGGDKEAARRRDALVAALDPETIRTAEADVATWRSRGVDRRTNDARYAGDLWRTRPAMSQPPQSSNSGSGPSNAQQGPPSQPEMPPALPHLSPANSTIR